jgi:hypothetical protein
MNGDKKGNQQNNSAYNWKGVMDFIKEEVKTSTSEWTNERQNFVVKTI